MMLNDVEDAPDELVLASAEELLASLSSPLSP